MAKIFWTEEEKYTVVQKAVELLLSGVHTRKYKAVEEAQKCLPLNRRRTINGDTAIANIIPMMDNVIKKVKSDFYKADNKVNVTVTEDEPKATVNFKPSIAHENDFFKEFQSTIDNLQDVLTERLLQIFKPMIENVAINIKNELRNSIKDMMNNTVNDITQEAVIQHKVYVKETQQVTDTAYQAKQSATQSESTPKTNTGKQKVVVLGMWNGTGFKVKDNRYDNLDIVYCQDIVEVRNLNIPDSAILVQAVRNSPQLPMDIKSKFNEIVQSHGEYTNISYHLNDLNVRFK